VEIRICESNEDMARDAAEKAAELLRSALAAKESARFIAATGASQFTFLEHLARVRGIDWGRAVMFHLDEYVGLSASHPASFRKYLEERLIAKVHPGRAHLICGDAQDAQGECRRMGALISEAPVDVAFVGIGENGHLAFNDPPADFETEDPFIVVNLDEACRSQQVREGWFKTVDEVPTEAITMSIRQIMKSQSIVCSVPDKRKAKAVRDCLSEGAEVSPRCPASILKEHGRAYVFIDPEAASLLEE